MKELDSNPKGDSETESSYLGWASPLLTKKGGGLLGGGEGQKNRLQEDPPPTGTAG